MPVVDVQSTDLICRTHDMTYKAEPFAIEAGQDIRITWSKEKMTSPYTGIDPVGPCVFWLSPLEKKGVGKVWSKIHEYTNDGGEDAANWCSAKIVNSKNYYDFTIPGEIIPGKYLLRTEIIDIISAGKTNYDDFTMGPHFYSNCLVLDITGNGTAPLKNPVSIIDVYKPYYKKPFYVEGTKNNLFKLPGPAPYTTGKP
ncbi:hypothetical protein GGI19_001236 [Coemansia pectinata]|uniref:AA9 family lytic polysaccharide monooxygenase n=1 Tax=Coemansia pectinata TaxID=1052879 RepID=A0A9W8LCZ9_9FUNG|nr:hypothetical protein GGI19_001236 [Coemansia pectinata]